MSNFHRYTPEQIKWLKKNVPGNTWKDILKEWNDTFNLEFKLDRLQGYCNKNKIYTGSTGRFEKGHNPWNKNTKGLMSSNVGTWKKGNIPHHTRDVGEERIDKDGYLLVKISHNKWKRKHRLIYEQYHGITIPKGHIVIFLDQDKRNFDIDNLKMISQKEHLIINHVHKYRTDKEINNTLVNMVKLNVAIKEKMKQEKR